jgi:hypothetical protein
LKEGLGSVTFVKHLIKILLVVAALGAAVIGQQRPSLFDGTHLEKAPISGVYFTWGEAVAAYKAATPPQTIFLLVNTSAVGSPPKCSDDYVEISRRWLSEHSAAYGYVVSSVGAPPGYKHVWIFDNDESLNIYLVRKGACKALAMKVSHAFRGYTPYITNDEIKQLHKSLEDAEMYAIKSKVGIWAAPPVQ